MSSPAAGLTKRALVWRITKQYRGYPQGLHAGCVYEESSESVLRLSSARVLASSEAMSPALCSGLNEMRSRYDALQCQAWVLRGLGGSHLWIRSGLGEPSSP